MVLARMRQLNTFLTFLVSYSALVISFGQRSGPHLGRWSYFIEQFPALVRRRRHELAAPSIPAPTHTPPAIAAPPPRPPPPPPPPPPAPPVVPRGADPFNLDRFLTATRDDPMDDLSL